jgi:hypothetical protein
MNVATPGGKAFVIAYSCVGMWVFGWASSHLSEALERGNSRAALWSLTKWSSLKRAVAVWRNRKRIGVEDGSRITAAVGGQEQEQEQEKHCSSVAQLKAAFDACDSSGDGEIDVGELGALTASLGVDIDEESLEKVLAAIDVDRSGTIGFEEFRKLMSRLSPSGPGGGVGVDGFVAALRNLIRVEAPVILAASLAFILVSSLVIKWVEQADAGQGWLYIDIVWFMFISTTTIGLGDMSPDWNREPAAAFEVAVMAVGCVLVALAIGVFVEWYDHAAEAVEHNLDLAAKKTLGLAKSTPARDKFKVKPENMTPVVPETEQVNVKLIPEDATAHTSTLPRAKVQASSKLADGKNESTTGVLAFSAGDSDSPE